LQPVWLPFIFVFKRSINVHDVLFFQVTDSVGLQHWSEWGTCSSDCGNGLMSRQRKCTTHEATNIDNNCKADIVETRPCIGNKPCLGKSIDPIDIKPIFTILVSSKMVFTNNLMKLSIAYTVVFVGSFYFSRISILITTDMCCSFKTK
jgi:hypothetical protein